MTFMNLSEHRRSEESSPVRKRTKSPYELYPLPFFNSKTGCMWDVQPTGNYSADCETGHAYAIAFLKTADGSYGWNSLLGGIVTDMIQAGSHSVSEDGHPHFNGVVSGFMSTIGRLVNAVASRVTAEDIERLPP